MHSTEMCAVQQIPRMVSPAMLQMQFYTQAVPRMESLLNLETVEHPEIVRCVLGYEDRLFNMKVFEKDISDMLSFLGIKVTRESLDGPPSVVATRSTPPHWNRSEAAIVCNWACSYKLVDIAALLDGSVPLTTVHPPRGSFVFPDKTSQLLMDKLDEWPKILRDFRTIIGREKTPTVSSLTEVQDPCILLLRALANIEVSGQRSKVLHNLLVAATHIAFIEGSTTGAGSALLPDLPDLSSESSRTKLLSHLDATEAQFIEKLFSKQDGDSAMRFYLQLSLMISPLFLLLPQKLGNKPWNRNTLMQASIALGVDKPDVLIETEKEIWKCVFSLVKEPNTFPDVLRRLCAELPWSSIENLEADDISWFNFKVRRQAAPLANPVNPEPIPVQSPGPGVTEGGQIAQRENYATAGDKTDRSPISTESGGGKDDVPIPGNDDLGETSHNETAVGNEANHSGTSNTIESGSGKDDVPMPGNDRGGMSPNAADTEANPSGQSNDVEMASGEDAPMPQNNRRGASPQDQREDRNSETLIEGDSMNVDESGGRMEQQEQREGEEQEDESDEQTRSIAEDGHNTGASSMDVDAPTCSQNEAENGKLRRSSRQSKPAGATTGLTTPAKLKKKNQKMKGVKKDVKMNESKPQKDTGFAPLQQVISRAKEQQAITLQDSGVPRIHFPDEMIVYGCYDDSDTEHPFFNVKEDLNHLKKFYDAVNRCFANKAPLHNAGDNDERTVFDFIEHKEFLRKSPAELQEMYRRRHIVVTNCPGDSLSFEEGLKTLEKRMTSIIPIQDQSIPTSHGDFSAQLKFGTLKQFLEASRRPDGRILNALSFPMSFCGVKPSSYSSDFEAYMGTQGRPFCKEEDHHYPTSDMRFGLGAHQGARHWLHIDAGGVGTTLHVENDGGSKWWLTARNRIPLDLSELPDHSHFSSNLQFLEFAVEDPDSTDWDFEAICLKKGDMLIMRPNTPHMVITLKPTICHGSHFYATSTLRDSFYGIVHCLMADKVVTNTEHPAALTLLQRLIHYFHEEFVINSHDISEKTGYLPDLTSMEGLVDFLTLCNLGILFNALDIRSYQLPAPDAKNDTEPLRIARFDEYDFNAIPFLDRGRNVYARGLSIELLRWVQTHFELELLNGDDENVKTHQQFHFTYIIEQALCIVQYKDLWDKRQEEEEDVEQSQRQEEGEEDAERDVEDDIEEDLEDEVEENARDESRFTQEALRKQISWAMLTIPGIKGPWNEAMRSERTISYMRSSEEHLYTPCYLPGQMFNPKGRNEIYKAGLTGGDNLFFNGEEMGWPVSTTLPPSKRKRY